MSQQLMSFHVTGSDLEAVSVSDPSSHSGTRRPITSTGLRGNLLGPLAPFTIHASLEGTQGHFGSYLL